jgi:transposase-like protein
MPKQTAAERRFPLVQQLECSALTTRDFADQHDVNSNTLGWWRAYFRREGTITAGAQ